MRSTPTGPRRWVAALLAMAIAMTIGVAAAPAWAHNASPGAPTAEVCAPGAMTITRDGPVVYDGVDCELGPHAAAAVEPPHETVLRPAAATSPAPPAPPTPETAALTPGGVAAVIAVFGGLLALLQLSRARQRALLAGGLG